jgi:hypothetical protein
MSKLQIFMIFLAVILVFGFGRIILNEQIDMYNKTTKYCNDEYGEDNWVWSSFNTTQDNIYQCVPNGTKLTFN